MLKSIRYLSLLIGLFIFTGCETIKGAANGMAQDIHNAGDPNKNGWNSISKADAWIQQNMW